MVDLGTQMPSFSLLDAYGIPFELPKQNKGTLIVFMCNHCPYVVHVAELLEELHSVCKEKQINMVGINSNDIQSYPEDSPKKMIEMAAKYNWTFPYLFDGVDQSVAKAFHATCTPDVFLLDNQSKLYYRGQFDDSRPSSGVSDGRDVIAAIDALVEGAPPPPDQKASVGCNIKWKSEI